MSKRKIIGICLNLLFLWLALRNVHWEKLPAVFSELQPLFVIAFFASYTFEYLVRSVRWKSILERHEIQLYSFFAGHMLGAFFNNILPARAGELIRSVYLGRSKLIPVPEAFGSVVLERFLDGMVVMLFIVISLIMFPVGPMVQKAGYTAIAFYLTVMVVLLFLQFKKGWIEKLFPHMLFLLPENFRRKTHNTFDSFVNGIGVIGHPLAFLKAFFISLVAWCFSLLTLFLGMKSFSLPFGIDAVILLISVLAIGASIPSSPGMIGIYEYCCKIVFVDILKTTPETAISYAIFCHVMTYLYVIAIGSLILFRENLSLKDLQKEEVTESVPG